MWEVHPRNPDLTRSLDPVTLWTRLDLVERNSVNDSWVLEGPTEALEPLAQPGMGCILDRDGEQVTSGQLFDIDSYDEFDRSTGRRRQRMVLAYVSDLEPLGGRVVYPNRTHVLTENVSTFPLPAHDTRTGLVETVLLEYVSACMGTLALADRRLAGLLLPASEGRGGTTHVTARFDQLGALVQDLAAAGGLRVRVEHDESTGVPRLALRVTRPPDVSDDIRFGLPGTIASGRVLGYRARVRAPEMTRAIVAAAGVEEDRRALMVVDAAAEALWVRSVERVVDQRQTDDVQEMRRAARRALEEASSPVEVEVSIGESPDVQYRRDFAVGYRIGLELPGVPVPLSDQVVQEARTTVQRLSGQATEQVQLVVGTPGASGQQTGTDRQAAGALRRVTAIERSR